MVDGEANSADPAIEAFPPILRKNREYLSYFKPDCSEEQNVAENKQRHEKLRAILAGRGELKAVSTVAEGSYVTMIQ
ncbi:MAG: hypothetical protein ACRC2T_04020 [Thermoguttaceae bacterium]